MIKALFWDNDGILVDTERLYFQATRESLGSVGIDLSPAQYLEWFMVQGCGAWHLAEERGLAPEAVEALRRERNERYHELLRREDLVIPGVREVLETLFGRFTMGIVTSSEREPFEIIHRRAGLLPFFQFVLAHGDFTHSKPHPEPYLRALERSGFRQDECLVIEDTERGLAAATAAGLRCVVVPTELARGCAFHGAWRVLEILADLLDLLPDSADAERPCDT
ncbi:MAG: HAD family phosphatase [bacterium]|jgi:HAD superfamily hydrolase (TIGR01509 family)|nr:HAD family phosphatase [bacterium]